MTTTRPPETDSQRACREWWQAREPHVTRAWGRDTKTGAFLAESTRALHAAWVAAGSVTSAPSISPAVHAYLDHFDPNNPRWRHLGVGTPRAEDAFEASERARLGAAKVVATSMRDHIDMIVRASRRVLRRDPVGATD